MLTDIAAVAAIAHARGIPVLVDNTFCTPYLQKPLALGADIVLHSATKYIGGHGDTVAGILVGKADWILRARMEILRDVGGCISPFNAWLLLRGLKTLPVRMDRTGERDGDGPIPGLPPQGRQGHLSRSEDPSPIRTGQTAAARLRRHDQLHGQPAGAKPARSSWTTFELCTLAVSLGDVDTLIEHPAIDDPLHLQRERAAKVGIDPAMVRLSVGLENVEDIIADLRQALALI